jgi:hypothetical protein
MQKREAAYFLTQDRKRTRLLFLERRPETKRYSSGWSTQFGPARFQVNSFRIFFRDWDQRHFRRIKEGTMTIERSESRLRSRYDHIFFQAFAVFAGVVVFLGFMQTYYLPGVFTVPAWKTNMLPPHPLIVHIHGVLFSSWFVLLIVQTSLVAGHRVNWHRRLGQATIGLAGLMLVVGFVVSSENLARNFPPGDPRIGIAATNFLGVLIFSILVYFAYRERTSPAAHKRLMLVSTLPLLWAAFIRWPVPGIGGDPQGSSICCYSLLFLLAAYDLWSTRNSHRATLWGIISFDLNFNPLIYESASWHRFAAWMQSLGHLFR